MLNSLRQGSADFRKWQYDVAIAMLIVSVTKTIKSLISTFIYIVSKCSNTTKSFFKSSSFTDKLNYVSFYYLVIKIYISVLQIKFIFH